MCLECISSLCVRVRKLATLYVLCACMSLCLCIYLPSSQYVPFIHYL